MGALEASYTPLEVREHKKQEDLLKVEKLGYFHENQTEADKLVKTASAIDLGRIVAKDIGGSDPERMSAANVLKYLQEAFKDCSSIKVTISMCYISQDDLNNYLLLSDGCH